MVGPENQVLVFALAIHLGMLLSGFFDALTRDIVLPLLTPIAPSENGFSKLIIPFGTIKLNVGDVIVRTLNLVIGCTIVYFTLPYIKEYIPIAGRR